jgi:8-oxo-dGTP pyrophosphatase MutT (NUDIX family)
LQQPWREIIDIPFLKLALTTHQVRCFFELHMNTESLLSSLIKHAAENAIEERYRVDTIYFVRRFPQSWWQRSVGEGHVTASAMVINRQRTHALLLHHAKLNRWLQPGGHIDDADISPAYGALREAQEESGLPQLALASENLFDVDVHAIPARGAEPAHLHYDVRYLVIANAMDIALSDESLAFQWKPLNDLLDGDTDESIARMARKVLLSQ